jgi:hypothetical protein
VRIAILTAAFFLVITCTVQQNSDPLSSNQLDASGREIQRRQSEANKTGAIGAPCVFNFERGEVPNCVFKSANGDIAVARRYLKELVFDSYGLAAVRSSTERWMYVNRKGKVLISGVPVMDNWADTFHDGLVRSTPKVQFLSDFTRTIDERCLTVQLNPPRLQTTHVAAPQSDPNSPPFAQARSTP